VANNPKFAEKVKVPVNVGKEFVKADKAKGAKMKKTKRYEDGGYLLDSEGKRVKSGSGDDVRSGSYDKEAEMESARKKLAQDVQSMVKAKGDSDRLSYDAEQGAKAPEAASAKMPAKAKSGIVTKEELAKSGLSLRDYMNKQRGLTRRDGKAAEKAPAKTQSSQKETGAPVSRARPTPSGSSPKQTMGGNYSNEGRGRPAPAPVAREKRAGTALPMSEGVLKQREADEKRREGRREQGRIRDAESDAKRKTEFAQFNEAMKSDPKQKELKDAKDKDARMSPGQRSAARGKAVKEFFGMAKGGSVRGSGIAQRGVRKCKMV
jgi:hypothetical protein